MQAFDRYAFERLLLMPDDQLLLNRVYTEVHIVAYQSLLNIISDVIEDHGAIVADFTNKVLAMHMAEPSIGVYQAWNWWQSRQRGKRDTRRAIPAGECLVESFLVVMLHKGFVDFPNLFQCVRTHHQQTFLLEGAMIALDKRVEIGSVWWADDRVDPPGTAGSAQRRRENRVHWHCQPNGYRDQR